MVMVMVFIGLFRDKTCQVPAQTTFCSFYKPNESNVIIKLCCYNDNLKVDMKWVLLMINHVVSLMKVTFSPKTFIYIFTGFVAKFFQKLFLIDMFKV